MFVVVYGTLKEGCWNNRLLDRHKKVSDKVVEGYKLYDAGFPVAMPADNSAILGELWDIGDDKDTLRNLDYLENEGRMYHRTEIEPNVFMYVGDAIFWNNERLEELPKNDQGQHVWHPRVRNM